MNARKNANGKVIKILPAQASKTVNEYLDDYRDFEAKVVQHLQSIIPADLDGKTA